MKGRFSKELRRIIMNNQEKIDLINTLHSKITDCDADGEVCYYVIVPLDDEVRNILKQLGYTDEFIDLNKSVELGYESYEYFDLTDVAWDFANWWHPDKGFY